MSFCTRCGAQIVQGSTFCHSCGTAAPKENNGTCTAGSAAAATATPTQAPVDYSDPVQDANANKVYGVLAYIGPLVLISLFAAPKESHFSRYHTNQGLVLWISTIAIWVVLGVLTSVSLFHSYYWMGGWAISLCLVPIINLLILGSAILGIVHAAKGELKPLPLIGKLRILRA